jgi:alanine-synthesizing transaminase
MYSTRLPDELEANRFTKLLHELRASGRPLLDLTISNPTEVGLKYPVRRIEEILGEASAFPYEPNPRGLKATREAIASFRSGPRRSIRPDPMWLTSGTSEAYGFLMKLLASPGDEILIPVPSYPLFSHLLQLEGVRPVVYPLRYAEGWFIDLKELEALMRPTTKAVIVVNPNNPTGNFVRASEKEDLLSLCAGRNLPLIVDEVFFEFPLGKKVSQNSFAQDSSPALTFVLDGFSKLLGLPQMKLSWITLHGPARSLEATSARLDWISDLYLSVGTKIQKAVPALLPVANELTSMIHERVRTNWQWLSTHLDSHHWDPMVTEGGWCVILRSRHSMDEEKVSLSLLENEKIVVHPGYFFDLPFRSSLVVSLLPEPEGFARGVERVQAAAGGR